MKSHLVHAAHVVYAAYASEGTCLYVGTTSDFPTRKSNHMATQLWAKLADRWEQIEAPDRRAALVLERITIREQLPLFNIKHNPAPHPEPFDELRRRLRSARTSRPVILRTDLLAWLTS